MTAEPLPPGYSLGRPSATIEDELLAIAEIHDTATVGAPDDGIEYIRQCISSPCTSPDRDGWIVRDEHGVLVAWAFIENPLGEQRDYGGFYTHPDAVTAVYPLLLQLLMHRSAERAHEAGRPHHKLMTGTVASQVFEEGELARRGFTNARTSIRMRRDIDGSEGQLPIPDWITFQQGIDREDDDAMRAMHHVDVESFRTPETTEDTPYEAWLAAIDAAPTTPYDEWILLRADDKPVGFMKSEADDCGWIDLIGVVPDYRGRGLGRLMLDRAFATFGAKGFTHAELGFSGLNTAARALYEASGMHVRIEHNVWQVELPARASDASAIE